MQAPKSKARMPPSQIPPAQVQAMIAEMRASGSYPELDPPAAPAMATESRKRGVGPVVTWVLAGALAGAVIGYVAPNPSELRPAKPVAEARAPAPTFMAVTATPAATPAPPPVAVPTPIEPALRAATPLEEAKPKSCLAGGPCTKADVAAAERRLTSAYNSARKAGVSQASLSAARSKWNTAKARSSGKPRTTVGAYRAIASDLNAKTAKARKSRR